MPLSSAVAPLSTAAEQRCLPDGLPRPIRAAFVMQRAVLSRLCEAPHTTSVQNRETRTYRRNLTTGLTDRLPGIAVRTLVLWGADDRLQPVRFGERLARDIPRATLVRVPRARHFGDVRPSRAHSRPGSSSSRASRDCPCSSPRWIAGERAAVECGPASAEQECDGHHRNHRQSGSAGGHGRTVA